MSFLLLLPLPLYSEDTEDATFLLGEVRSRWLKKSNMCCCAKRGAAEAPASPSVSTVDCYWRCRAWDALPAGNSGPHLKKLPTCSAPPDTGE